MSTVRPFNLMGIWMVWKWRLFYFLASKAQNFILYLAVKNWKTVYCTGCFICTRFLKYNCWEILFVKLWCFFEDHSLFWSSCTSLWKSHLSEEPSDFDTCCCCIKACWLGDFSKVIIKNMVLFGFASYHWWQSQNNHSPLLVWGLFVFFFFPFWHFYGCCPFIIES